MPHYHTFGSSFPALTHISQIDSAANYIFYVLQHKSKNYTYMTKKYTNICSIHTIFASVTEASKPSYHNDETLKLQT